MRVVNSIVFNIFFACAIYGQAYHPLIRSNTTWDIQHGDGSQICILNGGGRYFFQSDTIIVTTQYDVVRTHPIVNIIPGPYCSPFAVDNNYTDIVAFMREDTIAKKVYIFDQSNNVEDLLYDFNLSAGDTLNSFFAGQGIPLVIDSVTNVTLMNGAVRKIFSLTNGEYYIESIGGSQGLCFPIMQATGYWEKLNCVKENNINLWGIECNMGFLGVDESYNKEFVTVLPNSELGILQIERNSNTKAVFTIFDLRGKMISEKKLFGSAETIDISQLASDIYIYSIESEQSSKMAGKFTVIK